MWKFGQSPCRSTHIVSIFYHLEPLARRVATVSVPVEEPRYAWQHMSLQQITAWVQELGYNCWENSCQMHLGFGTTRNSVGTWPNWWIAWIAGHATVGEILEVACLNVVDETLPGPVHLSESFHFVESTRTFFMALSRLDRVKSLEDNRRWMVLSSSVLGFVGQCAWCRAGNFVQLLPTFGPWDSIRQGNPS